MSTTTTTIDTPETIAAKIRAAQKAGGMAWLNVISDSVDLFDMRHEPPTPLDGPTTGKQVRALNDWEIEQFDKVFPKGHKVEGQVTVEGDKVITDLTLSGETADGVFVSGGSRSVWTVKDGRIVAVLAKSHQGPTATAALMEAMKKAGVQMPTGAQLGFDR